MDWPFEDVAYADMIPIINSSISIINRISSASTRCWPTARFVTPSTIVPELTTFSKTVTAPHCFGKTLRASSELVELAGRFVALSDFKNEAL